MGYRKYAECNLKFPDETLAIDDLESLCYVFSRDVRSHIATPKYALDYEKKPYQYRELIQHFLYRLTKDVFEDSELDQQGHLPFYYKINGVEYGVIEWNNERGLSINIERKDDEYWHLMPLLYLPPNILLRILLKMIEMFENGSEPSRESVLDFDLNS